MLHALGLLFSEYKTGTRNNFLFSHPRSKKALQLNYCSLIGQILQ